MDHLEDVVQKLPKLTTIQISTGEPAQHRPLARKVLDEHAQVILAAKALCPSLVRVSGNGVGHWRFGDRARWIYEDAWRTKYAAPSVEVSSQSA